MKNMQIGETREIVGIVLKTANCKTRSGKPFQDITFSDGNTEIIAKLFNEPFPKEESLITAQITKDNWEGGSYKILSWENNPNADITQLMHYAPDLQGANDRIYQMLSAIKNPELQKVTKGIYNGYQQLLFEYSSKYDKHLGSFLLKIEKMMKTTLAAAKFSPELNNDLLCAASYLYYIGDICLNNKRGIARPHYALLNNLSAITTIIDSVGGQKELLLKHCVSMRDRNASPAIPEALLILQIGQWIDGEEILKHELKDMEPNTTKVTHNIPFTKTIYKA